MTKIADLEKELFALSQQYRKAITEARSHTDPNLSPDGLMEKRAELAEAAKANFTPQLQKVRDRVGAEQRHLEFQAQRAVPKPEGSTRDAWDRARMLLDSGHSIRQMVSQADAEQLQALAEWGPSYLQAQQPASGLAGYGTEPAQVSAFQRSVAKRWSEIAPEGKTIREHLESAPHAARFEVMADSLQGEIEGRGTTALYSAAAGEMAFQAAQMDLGTTTDTESGDSE